MDYPYPKALIFVLAGFSLFFNDAAEAKRKKWYQKLPAVSPVIQVFTEAIKGERGSGPINPAPTSQPPKPAAPPNAQEQPVQWMPDPRDIAKDNRLQEQRHLDGGQDVLSFGDHGRGRDEKRANEKAALARALLQGQQTTKAEKINGLLVAIQAAGREVDRWSTFAERFNLVVNQQQKLIDLGKEKIRAALESGQQMDNAAAASQTAQLALKTFTHILRTAKPNTNIPVATDAWDEAVSITAETAHQSQQSVSEYLQAAIKAADPLTVSDFLNEMLFMHSRLNNLSQEVSDNITFAALNKAMLEKQLAELQK